MKKTLRLYRNKKDFKFGTLHVREGSAWIQISGKLKKTGKDTVLLEITFDNGNGTVIDERKTNELEE